MKVWLRTWRPALRIARRDALRARGRSALVVAMVALPVLALTAGDVLARSADLEPDEVAARELGSTQARLEPSQVGGPILQTPDLEFVSAAGDLEFVSAAGDPATHEGTDTAAVDPRDVVPTGYRALTSQGTDVTTRTAAGIASTAWTETLVGDPAFDGKFRLESGTVPRGPDEVAVTSSLHDRLGVEIGDTVELVEPARELTLTGVVDRVGSPTMESFWAEPGALLDDEAEIPPAVYLVGDRPVTWDDVLAFNEQGVQVLSRDVLLDPPPDSAVPFYEKNGDPEGAGNGDEFATVLALVMVVVLAALEVTLLAGAAFAVGARRQSRTLGLVASAGGDRSHVGRVVLAGGVVLGLAGAVAGIGLGLLLAAAARPVLTGVADADFGRFDVRSLELLVIAALGVVTGLLAAVLPARTAARQDPVAALTGQRGQVRTARKVPVIGVSLVAAGTTAAVVGSALGLAETTGVNPTNGRAALVAALIAGGAAMAQIGLIITTPAIVGLAGRWSVRLPLTGRLALRDAARHRGRSAPAVAAVLSAVTGSTALLLVLTALDARDEAAYLPLGPPDSGAVQLVEYDWDAGTEESAGTTVQPADRVLGEISHELPGFTSAVVETTTPCMDSLCGWAEPVPPEENRCPLWMVERELTVAERERAEDDWRCSRPLVFNSYFSGEPVGGAEALEAASGGHSTPEAVDTLEAGGVVVFDRALLDDGRVRFDVVSDAAIAKAERDGRQPEPRSVSLPGTYLEVPQRHARVVYSPAAAQALGLKTLPATLMLSFDHLPSADQEEAVNAALRKAGMEVGLLVERGYTSDYGLRLLALVVGAAVITLGAASIATGLAQADARADHATLAAVGAGPRLRRTLAAVQALFVAGLGSALGIAAGFVPAVAFIGTTESLDLVVPWQHLALVVVGIPLLAGMTAWLFTRSRIPLDRPLA